MAKRRGNSDKETRREQQRERERSVRIAREQALRRRRGSRILVAAVGVVAVALAVFFALRSATGGTTPTVVAASLGKPTADVPNAPTGQFKRVGSIVRSGGKAEVLFIGAQFCPFCAAERWSLVKALGQFGQFTNLRTSTNQAGQSGFGTIPTFDLTHAGYTSRYVTFAHVDTADRAGNPLQTMSSSESALFNQYDSSGSIPLVLIGGYAQTGSGYSPGDIDGKSFAEVQHTLQQGDASFARDINAEANVISALVCHADGGLPVSVCARPAIHTILVHVK